MCIILREKTQVSFCTLHSTFRIYYCQGAEFQLCRGWTKYWKQLWKIHFFINTELRYHLLVIQLLGIDSRKFRKVSSGILYHFHEEHLVHWQIMVEGFCFSPYSDHNSWTISLAIMLAREGVEVWLCAPETKTAYVWLAVCMGVLTFWKIASWVGNI